MPHALKRAFTCALSLLTALTVLASSASATQSAPASTRPTTAPQADHARHYDANSLQPATEPTQQPSATPISEEAPFLTPENLKPQLDLQSEENSRPSSIPATPPQATIDAAEPTSTAAHTSHDSAIVSSTNPSAAPTPNLTKQHQHHKPLNPTEKSRKKIPHPPIMSAQQCRATTNQYQLTKLQHIRRIKTYRHGSNF